MTPALEPGFTPHPVASLAEAQSVISGLLDVMDALLAAVEQETALVRAGYLSEAVPLQQTKTDLAQAYMAAVTRLKASQVYLAETAPDLLESLRKRHDLFHALLQINLTVLATAHAVSEGIMRGVSDELNRKAAPQTYGASGRPNGPRPSAMQPLTLSRVL
jgi:hypothetical protein